MGWSKGWTTSRTRSFSLFSQSFLATKDCSLYAIWRSSLSKTSSRIKETVLKNMTLWNGSFWKSMVIVKQLDLILSICFPVSRCLQKLNIKHGNRPLEYSQCVWQCIIIRQALAFDPYITRSAWFPFPVMRSLGSISTAAKRSSPLMSIYCWL